MACPHPPIPANISSVRGTESQEGLLTKTAFQDGTGTKKMGVNHNRNLETDNIHLQQQGKEHYHTRNDTVPTPACLQW
jgi:hypothetical protein